MEVKDYDRAFQDFNEVIRLAPKLAQGYNRRACAWLCKNEFGKAIQDFDQSILDWSRIFLKVMPLSRSC